MVQVDFLKSQKVSSPSKTGLVLLMGGSGDRCCQEIPKQFVVIREKPLYLHTLEIFQRLSLFDEIVLVSHPDWVATVAKEAPGCIVTAGASTRQSSCLMGLRAFSSPPQIVMIHDAVRPFVSKQIIEENLSKARECGSVNTCIASVDTIVYAPRGELVDSIPPRKEFLRGQTPQTFHFDLLLKAHEKALQEGISNASDDCQLVLRTGHFVHIVPGSERNFKITTEYDLEICKTIINL